MSTARIRVEHMKDPLGIDTENPLITWTLEGNSFQKSFRILATGSLGSCYDSGIISDRKMQHRIPKKFKSRERVEVMLWIQEETSEECETSKTVNFEMGLLRNEDWKAEWINPEL